MTTEKAMESPEVLLGKLDVEGAPAIVLFYSGATYSYISSKFVLQQRLPAEGRSRSLITSSPIGDVSCTLECKNIRILIAGE